jgi:prepilin-type N-terminal cleavage/methylation domain-containing protein
MFATISRKLRDRRGMTLIELVVVMSILAILVVAALPAYRGSRDRAYLAEARQVAQEFKTLAWGYFIENATFDGLTDTAIGFTPPNSPFWTYTVSGADRSASLTATGQTGPRLMGTATPSRSTTTARSASAATPPSPA